MQIPRKIYTNKKSHMIVVNDILNSRVSKNVKLIARTNISVLNGSVQNI